MEASLWASGGICNSTTFEINGHSIKRDISSLTTFERLVIEDEPLPHTASKHYQLIGSTTSAAKPAYVRIWERDLGLKFTAAQLTLLYQLTHCSLIESRMPETNNKMLSRWYRVLADLARI